MTDYELGKRVHNAACASPTYTTTGFYESIGKAVREACAPPGELTAAEMRERAAAKSESRGCFGLAGEIRALPLTKEAAK